MSNSIENQRTTAMPRQLEAYTKIAAEMAAVPESEYITINVDVMTAVSTALGALPEIRTLRPKFAEALPAFDLNHLEKLETYALATMHAQSRYAAASAAPERISVLVEEAAKIREQLIADVNALGKRGYLNASKLNELKGTNGFRNTASDLLTLASLIRDNWDKVSGKTAIGLDELNYAQSLGEQIVTAVGFKEQAPTVVAEVAVAREQAFSLFMTTYDEVRRAVTYLRWKEDDADDIAPSLYSGRSSKKKPSSDASGKADQPQPASAVAPASPATTAPTTATSVATPAIPVGLPGASPFLK